MHNHYLVIGSIFGVAMLGAGLLCADANAVSSSTTASVTVSAACTLSGANHNYYDTISGGETKTFGPSSIKATCNDTAGYSLYAIGFSGDSYTGNNTKMIGTNTNIDTATSGNTSRWSMQVASVAGTYAPTIMNSFDSAHVIPADYAQIAKYTSLTDGGDNAEGSNLQVSYTVSISSTQAVDTYTGKVKYTLVHPNNEAPIRPIACASERICYYANTNLADGTMGRQSATDGNTVKLFASNFSRDGYGFAGWSDAYDYATNPNAHFYGPNEDIVVPEGTTANGLSLYAVWVKSEGDMQDTNKASSVCNRLTPATYDDKDDADESTWSIASGLTSVSALTDTRDGNTYAIAKLSDNRCWMIENLRLADTHQEGANAVPTTLTLSNTNNPLNDGTNVTLKHNYTDATTYNTLSPNSTSAYDESTNPNGWCIKPYEYCMDQSRLQTRNTTNRISFTPTQIMYEASSFYSFGNYYNWYSATAGRGTHSIGANVTTTGDLCPINWHIPTGHSESGTSSGEFGLLSNSLGGYRNANNVAQVMDGSTSPTSTIMNKRIRHFPINFIYSGRSDSGGSTVLGTSGYYWASTAQNGLHGYGFEFYSGATEPGMGHYYKYQGRVVRCIFGN